MSTGPIGKNPYIQQILQQNLSSSSINPEQLKSSARLLNSAISSRAGIATISAAGSKINEVAAAIRKSGDLQAYDGFQSAVSGAGSSGEPLQMIRLTNSADFVARNNPKEVVNAFSQLAQAASSENSELLTTRFNKAFSSVVEKTGVEGLSHFNRAFSALNSAEYGNSSINPDQNVLQFFRATDAALATQEKDNATSNLGRLARGVELNSSADSIWNFFNDFIGLDPDKTIL